ncbi:MAG: Por secretion system C-terminal sorting protein, partial [Candidatus Krumholzibacteriota bacterium]|nr:Por secretion system C-terminal sorting protein [Candidatus Krumholzibacteriota bacterium]
VPYGHDGLYLDNEIWSPVIDWTEDISGDPIDPAATKTVLQFRLYKDMDMPDVALGAGYLLHSFAPGSDCGVRFGTERFIYYGSKEWVLVSADVSGLIQPGSDRVQIVLAALDLYRLCAGIPECGMCHYLAPMMDDVRLLRTYPGGMTWTADQLDMFGDGFPADGTTTGTVRMDAPRGDPAIVKVVDDVNGLAVEPVTGTSAVYVHVRPTSGQYGPTVLGDGTTYLSDDGEWTVGVCSPGISAGQFKCDLNDALFVPGDRVDFYFSARNGAGAVSYFSLPRGAVWSETEARTRPDEVQCLPTSGRSVLYVDAAQLEEVQTAFENAFWWLGVPADRFDIRAPEKATYTSLPVGNTLRDRARLRQLVGVYQTIIYNTGRDLEPYRVMWDDDEILQQFLDSTAVWSPGLYVSGDNAAHVIDDWGAALRSRLGITANLWDHARAGEPFSPSVHAAPTGIFDHTGDTPAGNLDTFIASSHQCTFAGMLDVMTAYGTGQAAMWYSNNPSHVATITNQYANPRGRTARGVTDAFSFERIVDDGMEAVPDRVEHLKDILEFLRGDTLTVTAIGGAPRLRDELEQNSPNPFNPVTTVRFTIAVRGRVSLKIFNVAGQLVKTLVDAEMSPRPEGFSIDWNGRTDTGEPVSSGVYFYRLTAGGFSDTKKMVYLK